LRFQNAGIKKSGNNKYFTYYELSDILPEINKLANELKFCCIVNFTSETATLDFVDLEGDGKITFTSPMAEVKLASGQPCQKLGASQTYLKRYLYQHCFEIVENDILDATIVCDEEEIDNLIAQVKARMNTFNDAQLDYANKAIKQRNVKMLYDCLKSK
jgi:hypothetical protein